MDCLRRGAALALAALLLMLPGALAEGAPPAAVGEAELRAGALDSYFDSAAFMGDSITRQMRLYAKACRVRDPGFLPTATFHCAISYSLYSASLRNPRRDAVNLKHGGQDRSLLQIVQDLQPRRVFVLLGANDFAPRQADKALSWYARLIERVDEVSPGTDLVVEGLPPVRPGYGGSRDYQRLCDAFNERLAALCAEKGVAFADIAPRLKGADGFLRKEYSEDGGVHLNDRGVQAWLEALRDHAYERYLHGQWSPE